MRRKRRGLGVDFLHTRDVRAVGSPRLAVCPSVLERGDQREVRRLVVRVALYDAEEVLARLRRRRERLQNLDVSRASLVPQGLRPILVAVLFEEVASVGGLGELEERQGLLPRSRSPQALALFRDLEERLHVDL